MVEALRNDLADVPAALGGWAAAAAAAGKQLLNGHYLSRPGSPKDEHTHSELILHCTYLSVNTP